HAGQPGDAGEREHVAPADGSGLAAFRSCAGATRLLSTKDTKGISVPEPAARDGGALCQRAELGPDDIRIDAARSDVNAEPAVDARADVLAADELRISLDALRDELRMLDVVRLAFDDAGYQHFAVGHLDRLEHDPLVAVVRMRRSELDH